VSNLGRSLGRVLVRLGIGVVLSALAIGLATQPLLISTTTSLTAMTQNLQADDAGERLWEPPGGQPRGPTAIGNEPPTPPAPDTLGDDDRLDDRLDELWRQCDDGWGLACDRLFNQSPLGSDYERFGVSCGNRPGVLHCQIELDGRPEDPGEEWPLPFPLPSVDDAPAPLASTPPVS
jgi:hypothetical protein